MPQEPCPIPAAAPAAEPCHVQAAGGFLLVTPGSRSPQLASLSDRYVSHFETEGPHVLLYFDSVSKEADRGTGFPELKLGGFPGGRYISSYCSGRELVV